METENKHGGRGRGQGRKATDGATGLGLTSFRITQAQRDKVKANGGSVWIRSLIDGADVPYVLTETPPITAGFGTTRTPELTQPQSLQERLDSIGKGHLKGMEALAALQELESRPAMTTPGGFHVPAKSPVTSRVFGPNDPF